MNRSTERILVTHVGSLPRPGDWLDMLKAKLTGGTVDPQVYDAKLTQVVAECVARQADCGVDVVSDGEMSKAGFFVYAKERLSGFEPRPNETHQVFEAEFDAFPEYYKDYFAKAMLGGTLVPSVPLVCTGPVRYTGEAELKRDLANLKAAVEQVECVGAFVPSIAPSGVGRNEYYETDEAYMEAVGDAMRAEYLAIVDAGFQLQIDDPFLSDIFGDPKLDRAQRRRKADLYVEAVNHALRGIPEEKVRFHTCYGINEGPRIHEAPLSDVVEHMLRINADVYSFEAANARHQHEYHVWETVTLPDGKAIMPGVVTHASNIVEHPELIAEWLVRFAHLVGRENVIAGTDCGFSSQATYKTEVHPSVVWEKLKAMHEGAAIASKTLWR
jgi:5-methyltetrahydropteroyltriglutamate--homocysteine methyltransferase